MNYLNQNLAVRLIGVLFLVIFFIFLYKLLMPRINAFGCMDDCNNFMGGYFLLHGKAMFSQIFFNHAPFMAHISEFVQYITHPQNLHEIVVRHRQFGILFDFASELIIFLRFGILSLPFALIYELSKFYLGGDRFLAEAYIVYPLVYMLGIFLNIRFKKKIFSIDYIIAALSTWFVLFIREPYALAVLLLFILILWGKGEKKVKILATIILVGLSALTFLSYNLSELFYNIVFVNKTNLQAENTETHFLSWQIYRSFVYPFVVFFQGEWQFLRYIEMGISALFLFVNGFFLWKKKWQLIALLSIILGFANIRYVVPGHEYYGAFHLLPWFALTIFATCYLLWEIKKWNKKITILGFALLLALAGFILFAKGSYIHDKIDQQTEFITNYGQVLQVGTVVNDLSQPNDTLFVDGFDDMIYMVSQRYSSYKYSWYTSLMPSYAKYTTERINMFRISPPDFYYGNCPKEKQTFYLLPDFIKNDYVRLYNLDTPSCLWIKKSKLNKISSAQWQKAGKSLYYLHQ